MKIEMTVGLEGPGLSLQPGGVYDPPKDEAQRLIDAGFAVPFAEKPMERAVKKRPAETRDADPAKDDAGKPEGESDA